MTSFAKARAVLVCAYAINRNSGRLYCLIEYAEVSTSRAIHCLFYLIVPGLPEGGVPKE